MGDNKELCIPAVNDMASNALPVPPPLEIHDSNAADKWRKFLAAWENYALATELGGKPQPVQVATLLTVIGEDGREVYSTFRDWAQDGDDRRILPVLRKFAEYCQPRKNVPFERYKFNKRTQESGESYEQYKTTLRKLSEACEFDTITPNEILRDRLIFGIHDTKVRERLLRETNLTLIKTDEICRAAESMTEQMRIVGQSNDATTSVHAVRKLAGQKKRMTKEASRSTKSETAKECWNCGRQHGRQPKELCPAFGKSCDLCGKLNHFANKCRQKRSGSTRNSVRAIGEPDEVFPVREGATLLDDSQCVTLKLDSGNYIRFQIDSGAQCNVLPLEMYKRATKDVQMNDVTKCQSSILAFGGSRLTVVGEVRVRVWRDDYKCILICKLVDSDKIRPILGRKACVGMKLIQYTDNDALHKPATRDAQVYAVEGALISRAAITEKSATVFGDGISELEGEHRIRLDDAFDPIQQAPRQVPEDLRDRLKATLDDMARDRESLPVSQERWQQLNHASENDNVCRELRATIQNGWPENKSEVPECVLPYYDSRDELTIQGNLIFKGQLLVVPAAVRTELISVAHASHIGMEGCLMRMRECLYWPRMTTQVKDYVSKCEVCLSHRSAPPREPLQQHDFIARPWSKIGVDLCQIDGRTLLVVCDYYSNFIEVARLNTVTTRSVLRELLPMFARFGLPDVLVSDNGPQFASAEFAVFVKQKGITHVTSSPHYAQSNGKAENAVKTLKLLFAKAKQSGESEYMALLDWRNTPSEGMSTSPAQRLMGRRCKTLLPTAGTLLKPRYDTDADTRTLAGRKRRQSFYYNQHARPLTPIDEGATVRMRLPGEKTWTPGTCTEQVNPRSYRVKVGGTVYRRNRRQLVCAGEDPRDETSRDDATSPPERDDSRLSDRIPETHSPPVVPDVLPDLRRSVRERKPPARLNDYVSAVYKT